MKKFLVKVSVYLIALLVAFIVVPYIIDPYNVLRKDHRDNGITPNERINKVRYILDNPEKYDSFLFGNSRVGAIHSEKLNGVNCYNMTYSLGVPSEFEKNIRTFIDNGIIPSKIYVGLDNMSYMIEEEDHYTDAMMMSYEYADENPEVYFNVYFNPVMVIKSLSVIKEGNKTETFDHLYDHGWWVDYNKPSIKDDEGLEPTIQRVASAKLSINNAIKDIKDLKDLCDENKIETIFFTNPMHYVTYNECVNNWEYMYFLDELAKVTDYYNFSILNSVTENSSNFIDTSHYTAEVGDMMIDVLNGNEDYNDHDFCKYIERDE